MEIDITICVCSLEVDNDNCYNQVWVEIIQSCEYKCIMFALVLH